MTGSMIKNIAFIGQADGRADDKAASFGRIWSARVESDRRQARPLLAAGHNLRRVPRTLHVVRMRCWSVCRMPRLSRPCSF